MTFTIDVLHYSHTDVGYTDTQEKMRAHHIGFIKEVLDLVAQEPRFKWNCETYWPVEQFLKEATPQEQAAFVKAVQAGNIGLSGSYLNLTELVSAQVFDEVMAKTRRQRNALHIPAKSALTSDINGYSWGLVEGLTKAGITNLMSCLHTHHGYHPLRKQAPFWWEGASGQRILAWNGEHYNLGNELGISEAATFEYTLQDGLNDTKLSLFDRSCERIQNYVQTLTDQGYAYDFVPISLSGLMTDNSPATLKILHFIDRYNALGGDIQLRMVTLDEFFDQVRASAVPIPTYRGDWTDWWADGIGSTPADVIQYRHAARDYAVAEKLDPKHELAPQDWYDTARDNLMFYAEHTWGYSSSITEPFHPQVNNLDQWKRLYALKAAEAATKIRERIQQQHGETPLSLSKEITFRAVNPHDFPIRTMLKQDLEVWFGHEHFEVIDQATGQPVPFQISHYSRGYELCIWLDLAAREEKHFALREVPAPRPFSAGMRQPIGLDGVDDLAWRREAELAAGGTATIDGLENDFYKISWQPGAGITHWLDKKTGADRLKPGELGAFTPVYEVTPLELGDNYQSVRRNLGRNRKAFRTQRAVGQLSDVKVLENGPLYTRVQLSYQLAAGMQDCAVILTAYKLSPKVDVDVRFHKLSEWRPENVYLALPFTSSQVALDKTDAIVRPRIDQLPGTCIDFYATQNGVVFEGQDDWVVASQDAPLVTMGDLAAHPIRLMGEGASNTDPVYSWLMNNFWETNFKADLGGFYQFHYSVQPFAKSTLAQAFTQAAALNQDVWTFYRFEKGAGHDLR
ncbi:glycoside hydrolase family 38 N-terminal domain-containing protein [Lacticaseibacillus suihuaensis]